MWIANQWTVPQANSIRGSFEAAYIDKNSSYDALVRGSSDIYFRVDSFTYAGIYEYDTVNNRGGNFFAFTTDNKKVISNLRAETIMWDTTKKVWELTSVMERTLSEDKEIVKYYGTLNKKYPFKPNDIKKDKYTKDKLTTPQLIRQIELANIRGSEWLNELKIETGWKQLMFRIYNKKVKINKNEIFEYSYFANGFSWIPNYTLFLDDEKETLDLNFYANIRNNSNTDLKDINLIDNFQ